MLRIFLFEKMHGVRSIYRSYAKDDTTANMGVGGIVMGWIQGRDFSVIFMLIKPFRLLGCAIVSQRMERC